jgi:NAD(P)-dependent dehydrogenase (short-subunit alcohol dehydrogenase family)
MSYWTDKVAVVTGGSAGLGLHIARALVEAGARVTIAARDPSRLASAAASLSRPDRECTSIATDVTRQEDCTALVRQVLAKRGRIHALVHCAGRSTRGEIAATTAQQFSELIDTNFLSAVRLTTAALPVLLHKPSHLVLIGSLASKSAAPYLGAYPASKFPLAAYAQQLRLELGPRGLHTLLVCPGPIRRDDAGERYAHEAANLPPEARRPGGGVKLQGIDPAWLAGRVLRACERRQAELIVPARAKLLLAISDLWPSLGDWIVRRMTK